VGLSEFPVWMRVLRYLCRYDDVSETQISKELDTTYSHIVKSLVLLHRDGKISFRVNGRSKFVSLTDKGREDAVDIDRIMSRRDIPVTVQRGAR
jgi:DNA-binding MarR family transcriptional regulator